MRPHRFDALTADAMRAGGSWKWSRPGLDAHGRGLIGAFVAECRAGVLRGRAP